MKKLRTYLVVMLLALPTLLCAQYRVSYLQKGRIELWEKNYQKAIDFFNASIKSSPNDYKAYYFRGLAKYYLDDLYGAEKDISRAIDIVPIRPDYFLLRGVIRSDQLKYLDALSDMNAAIELDTNYTEVYYYRSLIHLDLRDYQKALADCEKAIASGKDFQNIELIHGMILSSLDRTNEALEIYNQVVANDSSNHRAIIQQGALYMQTKKHDLALENFNYVLQKDSLNSLALYQRAMAYMQLEEFDLALSDLNTVLEYHPNNQLAYFNRAILQSYAKQNEDAIFDYSQILRKNPDNLLVYYNLGITQYQMGQYKASIQSLNKVLELYPDYANAYRQRALSRQKMGDMAGYIDDIEHYEAINEKNQQKSDTTKYQEGLKLLELTHLSSDFARTEIMDNRPQYRNIDIDLKPMFFLTYQNTSKKLWHGYTCNDNCKLKYAAFINGKPTFNNTDTIVSQQVSFSYNKGYEAYAQILEEIVITSSLGFIEKSLELIENAENNYPGDFLIDFIKATNIILMLEEKQQNTDEYNQRYGNWLHTNFNQAISLYNTVIAQRPDFYFAYYNRAYAWFLIEDYEAAIADYQKAVDISPNAPTYYNMSLLLLITNKKEQGCSALSKAGELGLTDAYSIIKEFCNK